MMSFVAEGSNGRTFVFARVPEPPYDPDNNFRPHPVR